MKFCPYCGHATKMQCPFCKTIQSTDYFFCSECGKKLNVDEAEKSLPTINKEPVKRDYPHFTHEEGDIRKHATVLFSDLKGSTHIVEGLDPEEAKNILIPVIDAMREAILSYGGSVIKTAGDGIVAVFGAPQSVEDHALRACLAALSIHENIDKVNPALKVRVGLNSGEVYLEMIGDKDYDITGQTVNLAARMEQTAEPGSIQLTKNTLSLVEDNVQVTFIGAMEIKGFSLPIDVFELNAVIERKLLSDFKEQPSLFPFIGRVNEINQLNQLAEEASNGNGNAVGIIAEAGQGRSRLLYEFLRKENITAKFTVLMTRCFSYTNNVPYAPLKKILQQLINITPKETLASAREKIYLFIMNTTVPHAMQAALILLGFPSMDLEWDKIEAQIKRRHQIETIISILLYESLKKPLILIIEESYLIDSETEAFLDDLISNLSRTRILLILTSRPQYVDHWINRKEYTQIRLKALSQKDEGIALNAILGDHPSLQEIKLQLLQNAAGNPFFLEEMVKSLIHDKILIGTEKNYQLNENALAGKLQLPESIFAVIQTQLDNLSSLERKILRMASVIGERFTYRMLTKIVDNESNQNIQQALRTLTANQFIYEARIYPEPESAFKHALIHEVAYNSLLKSLRKAIHIKILALLETLPDEEKDLQLQAYHAYQGEDWEKAFNYCYEAGHAMFFKLSANKVASALYHKALAAAEHLPKSEEIIEKCLSMHLFLITIYRRLCRFQDEGKHINELEKLLKQTNHKSYQSVKVLLSAMMGSYHLSLGEIPKAYYFYEKSFDDSQKCNDKMITPLIESYSSFIYFFTGQYKILYAKAEHAIKSFPSLDYRHELFPLPMGHFANFLKWWGHAYTGDYQPKKNFDKLVKDLMATTDIQRSTVDTFYVLMPLGALHFYQGHYQQTIEYLSRALILATEIEILGYMPVIAAVLACAHLRLNQVEEGKKFVDQAISLYDSTDSYTPKVMALDLITEALFLLGDYPVAKSYCQQALETAHLTQLAGIKVTLLRLNAEIDLQLPSPNYVAIKQQLQQAIEYGDKLGMVSNYGRCQLVLAKMYHQLGDQESYEQAMQLAQQCFDELDINYMY